MQVKVQFQIYFEKFYIITYVVIIKEADKKLYTTISNLQFLDSLIIICTIFSIFGTYVDYVYQKGV